MAVTLTVTGSSAGSTTFGSAFQTPAVGDLEIVLTVLPSTYTVTPPVGEGWTEILNVILDRRLYAWRRIATSATKSSLFTKSGSSFNTYLHVLAKGYNTTTPIPVINAVGGATAVTQVVLPSLTANAPSNVYFGFFGANRNSGSVTDVTAPGTMTSGALYTGDPIGYIARGGWETLAASGASGTRTGTFTGSGFPAGIALLIQPPGLLVPGVATASLGGLTTTAAGRKGRSGAVVASLGGLSVASAGKRVVRGATPGTLGGLSATGVGARRVVGEALTPLGGLSTTVVGRHQVPGVAVVSLGKLTVTAVNVPLGTAALPLGGLSATVTGRRRVSGQAAVQAVSGGGGLYPSDVLYPSSTLYPAGQSVITFTASGRRTTPGAALAALGGLRVTVELAVSATAAVPLGGLSATVVGRRTVSGAGAMSPGSLYLTVSGGASAFGTVSIVLGGLGVTAVSGSTRWAVKITPQLSRPTGPGARWELLVAETIGGQVIAGLPFTDLAWNTPINDIGTLTATIPIEQHTTGLGPWDDRDPRWILRSVLSGEWKFSLCAVFDGAPIIAGPLITSQPVTGAASVTLGAAELPALLKRRMVIAPGYTDPTDLAADVHLGPVSLPQLVRQLIELGTDPANGAGWLLPLLVDTVDPVGDHVRHYPASDLATVWERIEDLTEVENGPDIRFEPALTEAGDGQRLHWVVRIGQPHLGTWIDGEDPPMPPWIWDSGANLRDLTTDRDASDMTMRAFVPGQAAPAPAGGGSSVDTTAPQDSPKPIGRAADPALLAAGYPILESTYTGHTSVSRQDTLDAHAAGYVAADSRPVETWTVTVDADTDPRLGDWHVGDAGRFDVRGQLMVDDGVFDRRIVGASGTAGTDVQLVLTSVPAQV